MGHPQRIYSGAGAQVSLYDSVNGLLFMGYIAEEGLTLGEESNNIIISDGNGIPLNSVASFEIPLLQSDAANISALDTRRGTLQEVYIIGQDSAVKITDAVISHRVERSYKPGEAFKVFIRGRRIQQDKAAAEDLPETHYIQFIQNLLGGFGAILGAGSIGTGWTNDGGGSLALDTSFLGGGFGDHQEVILADAGDFIYCRVRFPLDALSIKFTFSVTINGVGAGNDAFYIGFRTRDSAEALLSSYMSSEIILASGAVRYSHTETITPDADCQYIEGVIAGSVTSDATIEFDNAQLEPGELTDYVENDY